MVRAGEEILHRRFLDDLAAVHDEDSRDCLGDDAEIVCDEQDRGAEALLKVAQQLEDLRLDRHVERRRRLVGDHERGIHDERHRNHDALAHPAGELMRVFPRALRGRGNTDHLKHFDRALPRLAPRARGVDAHHLRDLFADGEHRVERGHRFLEHHRDPRAAHVAQGAFVEGDEVPSLEENPTSGLDASGRPNESQDRERRHRLAASRFANETDRLARRDGEGDAVYGAGDPGVAVEEGLQVLDGEERIGD